MVKFEREMHTMGRACDWLMQLRVQHYHIYVCESEGIQEGLVFGSFT